MFARLLVVYGSKGFYALALVAVSTYVAREWGPAALGDYSVFLTLLTVASVIAVFGADMRYIETAPKVVGEVYVEEKVYATKTVLAVLGQTAVLLPLFGFVVAVLVPRMFWGTSALLFMAVVTITSSILVSQNRQVLNSVLAFMLRPALFFVAIAVLAAAGFDFGFSVPVSLIASFAIVAIIAVFIVSARPRRGFELKSYFTKRWWDASWAYVVIGLYPILFSQADRLLVLQMVGARETGFYSAAQNILNIANYAVNAVMSMALPLIASRLADKLPKGDFTKRMKRLSRGLFGFSVLCTAVFVMAGDLILSVFGEGFSAASLPLVVMSIGLAGGLAFGFPITVLTLSENRRSVIPLFVGLLCASLLLSTLGIYWWGILGAATAAAVSNIASRWVFHIVCVRKTGISTAVF